MRTIKINETRRFYEFLWENKHKKTYNELLNEYILKLKKET